MLDTVTPWEVRREARDRRRVLCQTFSPAVVDALLGSPALAEVDAESDWLELEGVAARRIAKPEAALHAAHQRICRTGGQSAGCAQFGRAADPWLGPPAGEPLDEDQPQPVATPRPKYRNDLTADYVRARLHYEDGKLIRKNGRDIGCEAGCVNSAGYRQVKIDGRRYLTHRLVWLLHHGEWPPALIDHIDHDPTNNRIENLRPATHSQNQGNMGTVRAGLKGAYPQDGRWLSAIKKDKDKFYLGSFDTEQQAHDAYSAAAARLYGDYARFE